MFQNPKKSAKKQQKSAKNGVKKDPQNVQKLTFLHVALLCTKKRTFCKNQGGVGGPPSGGQKPGFGGGGFGRFL